MGWLEQDGHRARLHELRGHPRRCLYLRRVHHVGRGMRGHLTFPNACRNYDATRVAVRFWGHDQSMEDPFFIGSDVLGRLEPAMRDDSEGCLTLTAMRRGRAH